MKRIEFIKATTGGLVGLSPLLSKGIIKVLDNEPVPDVVWVESGEPAELVNRAAEAFGGMGRFISKGDVVVVKPNIGWDRIPESAANTNPDLVAQIVRLCLDTGAKRVKVFDRTTNNPLRCYRNSQIETKAEAAGAKVLQVRDHRFKSVTLRQGSVLKEWPIYRDYLEADKVINVPVAKHHSMCNVTLGLKNLMGVMGGPRGEIHNGFDTKLVDITSEILPTLTIIDAYRIMTGNGPSGGSMSDVDKRRTLIMSPCTVTADYVSASLFKIEPDRVGYIREAVSRGVNRYDVSNLNIKKISL
ncbi:MAG: DUF362 domain-containing protein [Fidelibacterota bacterium]|nr:MAG: DUF362 domain-containing protein [Candidatus Neomarinimicrobiota bacterium]